MTRQVSTPFWRLLKHQNTTFDERPQIYINVQHNNLKVLIRPFHHLPINPIKNDKFTYDPASVHRVMNPYLVIPQPMPAGCFSGNMWFINEQLVDFIIDISDFSNIFKLFPMKLQSLRINRPIIKKNQILSSIFISRG